MQIPIPKNDPFFGSLLSGSSIQVNRAIFEEGTGIASPNAIPREHPNNITPWLDASMVYGDRAIDVIRGRDVGLGSLNDVRAALGLSPYQDFFDITSNIGLAEELADVYGNIDTVDLFVGLLAEDHLFDASIGETTHAIFELQFSILRDSDRFWFQHDLEGINSDLLMVANWGGDGTSTTIDWLNSLTLADILHLNTNARVQSNVFFAVPEPSAGLMLLFATLLIFPLNRRRSLMG